MIPRPVTQGAVVRSHRLYRMSITETVHRPRVQLGPHRHVRACLSWVLDGGFTESTIDVDHRCDRGTLLLKPASVQHRNHYGAHGARTLLIEICGEFDPSWDSGVVQSWPEEKLPPPLRRALGALIERWNDAPASPSEPGRKMVLEGLLLQVLGELRSWQEQVPAPGGAPAWLREARGLVVADPGTIGGLQQLADVVGIDADSLGRAFRRHYGVSFTDLRRARRVAVAATAIRGSRRELRHIALEAGFADQSHMTREFRHHLNTTPGALRAELR